MSGMVGIFNRDGAPVDRDLLERMTHAMSRRGPDAQRTWADGPVGFGHAALFTTLEAERENQPTTLDGQVWITADARVDDWESLRPKLIAKGQDIPRDVTDVQLILYAYHVWGEDCVDHLVGDFAFVIWDARQQRMFCARDHMGVKPFYYHLTDRLFVFASDVGALLAHPQVPRQINEGRIADFLVGDLEGIDKTSTFYLDIFRFPPAQCRTLDRQRHTDRTYWTLDPTKEIRLGSDDEYAEAFLEVFTEAVRCRLRHPDRVGSMLSGGLDSSSIVGVARKLLKESGQGRLKTFSAVSVGDDNVETQVIKAALDMDHLDPHLLRSDEMGGLIEEIETLFRESHDPFDFHMTIPQAMYILARRQGLKALLDGVDGDLAVSVGSNHLPYLIRQGKWATAAAEAFGISRFYHRWNISPWVVLVANTRAALPIDWLRKLRKKRSWKRRVEQTRREAFINEEFARKIDLAGRIERMQSQQPSARTLREQHARRLDPPYLVVALERYDRVAAHYSIEPRHPYLDKHLIEWCLAVEWMQKDYRGWSKVVNRRAMAGIVPDGVRWSTPRQGLSTEFAHQRFEKLRAHIAQTTPGIFLEDLGAVIEEVKARSACHDYQQFHQASDYYRSWVFFSLALWLQRSF